MIRNELLDLLRREPFEPFRIKLDSGGFFDVVDPQSLALLQAEVTIASADGNWAIFPLSKIACIESLIADFPGEAARHGV